MPLCFPTYIEITILRKQRQQLLPDIESLEDFVDIISENKFLVRAALWKSLELIGSYVKENPDGLSPEELSIICKWQGFIAGDFYVFRYLKSHTVFIGDSQVYRVLGLHESLEDIFYGRPLPIYIEAILLPFKGKIIYDGQCQLYNIHFGPGVRSGLNEQYMKAKHNKLIIATLEPETYAVRPAQNLRKLDKESEAMVEDIISVSEQALPSLALPGATTSAQPDSRADRSGTAFTSCPIALAQRYKACEITPRTKVVNDLGLEQSDFEI
jgi:hypothetical protein